jgi:uncharacterized membrane protein
MVVVILGTALTCLCFFMQTQEVEQKNAGARWVLLAGMLLAATLLVAVPQ